MTDREHVEMEIKTVEIDENSQWDFVTASCSGQNNSCPRHSCIATASLDDIEYSLPPRANNDGIKNIGVQSTNSRVIDISENPCNSVFSLDSIRDEMLYSLPRTSQGLHDANRIMKDHSTQCPPFVEETVSNLLKSDDASDDVSVITESDEGNPIISNSVISYSRLYSLAHYSQQLQKVESHMFTISLIFLLSAMIFAIFLSYTNHHININRSKIKNIKTERDDIINACKDLKEVAAMLNGIEAHILIKDKIHTQSDWQFPRSIKRLNNATDEPSAESLNSSSYQLNELNMFLRILPLIGEIDGSDSLLKSAISETLHTVNNMKALYKTFASLNDDTQNTSNFVAKQFLQITIDKIHYTTRSLLIDFVKSMSRTSLNVYNRYNKLMRKLNKKLCHLKYTSSDDNESNLLKQLTENNQLLSDYEKSCFPNKRSDKFNDKTKKDTEASDSKKPKRKSVVISQAKNDEKSALGINREKSIERDNEGSQSIEIQKCDISKDNFDNCPKFNTDTLTFDIALEQETKSHTVDFNSKQDPEILFSLNKIDAKNPYTEGGYKVKAEKPQKEDSSKFDTYSEKTVSNSNSEMFREKRTDNYYKSKPFSSFDGHETKRGNPQRKNGDWQFERSQAREQERRLRTSDRHCSQGRFNTDTSKLRSSYSRKRPCDKD